LGCHPAAVVDNLVQKCERETVNKTIQKHRLQKIENKYTKQENKYKKNIKKT
jgi:hypothetical protein